MTKRRALVVVLCGGAVWGLAASAPGAGAQEKSQAELRTPFIGTWRLVSIEGGSPAAAKNRGSKPTGLIIYDQHGLMSAQIMPDRPRPTWTGPPTPDQAVEALRGYTAYWGTYTIDEKTQTVTHRREGRIDGGAVDFVRRFELTNGGNRITLTPVSGTPPVPPATPTHLTWERVRNN
jgi:hypothetical protein